MNRKPFLVAQAELIAAYWPRINLGQRRWLHWLLPTPGNVLFTLLVIAGLLWAANAGAVPLGRPQGAAPTSTGTIAYQGRLADADGNPLTGTYNMIFRLYDVASGGTFLWEEQWTGSNGVRVSDGLFNVMLGSLTPIPQGVITGHDSLFLGITVGTDDEMQPRVQLGTVPFAVQALTVPDGSVTTAKLADGAIDGTKLGTSFGASGVPLGNLIFTPHTTLVRVTVSGDTDWTTVDLTNDTSSTAVGTMLLIELRSPTGGPGVYVQLRQKGSSGVYAEVWTQSTQWIVESHLTPLNLGQEFEYRIRGLVSNSAELNMFLLAYIEPAHTG